jgi:hypothetical protein
MGIPARLGPLVSGPESLPPEFGAQADLGAPSIASPRTVRLGSWERNDQVIVG